MSSEQQEHFEGVVIYTDGSCRPTNPGFIGWGAHGYSYTTELDSKGTGLASQSITNRGYIPIVGKKNETAKIVKPLSYFDFFGSSEKTATNNTAEVDAICKVLQHLKSHPARYIQIHTDSEYARRGLQEWSKHWERNNWKKADGTPVPNSENWKQLLEAYRELQNLGKSITVDWIRGHADHFGNEHADKLSVVAVQHSMDNIQKESFKISEAQGYWKSEVERHPFIGFQRLYFNSVKTNNDPGVYYIAEPGGNNNEKDWIIGKKFPESAYAVVRLKEPDPVIESIKEKQYDIASEINAVMLMRLDKVYETNTFSYLNEYGKYALLQDSKNLLNVNFLDKKPLTLELNPAGLSLRAIENFGMLDDLLSIYESLKANKEPNLKYSGLQVHDITSHFFKEEDVKKRKELVKETKLKPEFGVGFKDIMIEVNVHFNDTEKSIKIPLILGLDLMSRNGLKRIETLNPKILLLTWKEAEETIRYAVVVETDTGLGIWSNYFANRIIL